MMRRAGWWGLAAAGLGAGVGYLMYTQNGRRLAQRAGALLFHGYDRVRDAASPAPQVDTLIEDALAEPHPDTVMARALEEAAA